MSQVRFRLRMALPAALVLLAFGGGRDARGGADTGDPLVVGSERNTNMTRQSLAPTYYRMTNNNGYVLSGFAVDAGFTYCMDYGFAIGPRLAQAYSTENNFTALFNSVAFEMEYAITGSLTRTYHSASLYGAKVFENYAGNARGFRANAHVTQYYINSFKAAVPFSGYGIGAFYEFPLWRYLNVKFGAEMDFISSGEVETQPTKYYAGLVSMR